MQIKKLSLEIVNILTYLIVLVISVNQQVNTKLLNDEIIYNLGFFIIAINTVCMLIYTIIAIG